MKFLIVALILLIAQTSWAQASSPAKKPAKNTLKTERVKPAPYDDGIDFVKTTRQMRRKADFWLVYSPVATGLLLPSKKAYSAGWLVEPDWDVYLEYMNGELGFSLRDINLINFSESIVALNSRWYFGLNSFYLMSGIGQRRYKLTLGDDQLEDFGVLTHPPSIDVIDVKTPVLNVGIGNRWIFAPWGVEGLTFGMDWLTLHIPIAKGTADAPVLDYVSSESSRSKINDAMTVLRYLPTATIKLDLGWTF